MSNKIKKAYATDLFNIKGLDEMQLSELYKIAYNCFRAFFNTNMAIVCCIALGSAVLLAKDMVNIAFTLLVIIGSVIALATSIIYVVFALKLAKKGLMPSAFVKGAKRMLFGFGIILFINLLNMLGNFTESSDFFVLVPTIPMYILIIGYIVAGILTRKNNKVVAKVESEEE